MYVRLQGPSGRFSLPSSRPWPSCGRGGAACWAAMAAAWRSMPSGCPQRDEIGPHQVGGAPAARGVHVETSQRVVRPLRPLTLRQGICRRSAERPLSSGSGSVREHKLLPQRYTNRRRKNASTRVMTDFTDFSLISQN